MSTARAIPTVTRSLLGCVALLAVVGCATPSTRTETSMSAGQLPLWALEALDAWVGDYTATDNSELRLRIVGSPSNAGVRQTYEWLQVAGDSTQPPRRFFLSFLSGQESTLVGTLSVGNTSGASGARTCPMFWQPIASSAMSTLLGRTEASSCQFNDQGMRLGLVKEIALAGNTLRIADQMVNLDTGQAHLPAVVTEFIRLASFAGWAGRLEDGQWRVSRTQSIPTDGQRRSIEDEAGMSMGIAWSLVYRTLNEQLVLQLVVSNPETGDVLGQSWTSPHAERIGWANSEIQVELTKLADR